MARSSIRCWKLRYSLSVGGENIIRGGHIVDWVIDHPHPRPFNLGRSVPGLRPSTDRPRLKSKKKSHKVWYHTMWQVIFVHTCLENLALSRAGTVVSTTTFLVSGVPKRERLSVFYPRSSSLPALPKYHFHILEYPQTRGATVSTGR